LITGAAESPTGSQNVASITAEAGQTANDFTAVINWGDKHTSDGSIAPGAGAGTFLIAGNHQYKIQGDYQISVTIHHDGDPNVTVESTARIADAQVDARGINKVVAVEGGAFADQAVATFTDRGGPEILSHYSANIDWGDHSTSAGTISFDQASGVFTVRGDHRYVEEGVYSTHVTIRDADSAASTVAGHVVVLDQSPIVTGGFSFGATEGVASDSQTVATFTDPAGPEGLNAYLAIVYWGDGTRSHGDLSVDNHGVFTVRGAHTYAEEGPYVIHVTVQHKGAADVTVESLASVDDQPVMPTGGFTFQAVEGNASDGQVVATFVDPAGAEDPANYSATIDWGDHSQSDGEIVSSGSGFSVLGSHIYAEQGSYHITVTIHHGSSAVTSAESTASITDAPVGVATGTNNSLSEGDAFNGTVATFHDDNPNATAEDFSANINWGDGHTSAGTVIRNNDGSFSVVGSNTFVDDGSFTAQVTIVDHGGLQTSTTSLFSVGAIAPSLTLSGEIVGQADTVYTLHLSALEHGTDHITSFTIDWNDGTVQTVQVGSNATDFSVTHTYTDAPNFYSISASFTDEDGTHSASNAQALTILVPGLDLSDTVSGIFTPANQGQHLTLPGTMWATYNFPSTALSSDFIKVLLGRYHTNPEGTDLPEGTPLAYADVHLQFHVSGQPGGSVTLHFFLPPGLDPKSVVPQFFDGSDWKVIIPESVKSGIDSAGNNFIEVTLSADSLPAPILLTHTVFTIAVVTPAPATTTLIIPPLVMASSTTTTDVGGSFQATASFVQSTQLTLGLSASPERAGSGGGDNRELDAMADDPLLEPLELLLSGQQPDEKSLKQPKKPVNPTPAEEKKGVQNTPRKQPPHVEKQLLAQEPALTASGTDVLAGDIMFEEIFNDSIGRFSGAAVRDALFEHESVGESKSDVTTQAALAAIVLLNPAARRRDRKRKAHRTNPTIGR
jgi:hypothetical protein